MPDREARKTQWGPLPVASQAEPTRLFPICFIAPEFLGWPGSGGIASAYGNLAEALVAEGFPVTVLCAPPPWALPGDEKAFAEQWRSKGIELYFLDREIPKELSGGRPTVRSYQVFRWLQERGEAFRVVHVADHLGLGYMALLAKRQGLAFSHVTFVVGTHGGELMKEGHRELPPDLGPLEFAFLERESVRLADILVSPSRFYLELMERRRWELPQEKTYVEPNLVAPSFLARKRLSPPLRPPRELVFFGRLVCRKGVPLFCDALDRLAQAGTPRPDRVTFLGSVGEIDGRNAKDYVESRASAWPWPSQILSDRDRDQALDYLQEGDDKLAVMPSLAENYPNTVLECCWLGIPFLASWTWGIPEMIGERDRPRVLFPPNARDLARKMAAALQEGVAPAALAHDPADVRRRWIGFHQSLAEEEAACRVSLVGEALPLVSVCLVHYDRPRYLRQALDSLKRQDYPRSRFEVILIDDGSRTAEALEALPLWEEELRTLGWTLLRQENRGLGAAKNNAAAHAKGEYLLFMDDDNVARPEEISTFVRAALGSRADLYTCLKPYFSGEEPPSEESGEECWIPTGGSGLLGTFLNCFGDANALIRKKAFDALGGFSEEAGVIEDWEFFLRAVLRGFRLELVPAPLYWYRRGHPSLLTTSQQSSASRLFREYPVLESCREAMPPPLQELPFLVRGLSQRIDAERNRWREEREAFEAERHSFEAERIRWRREREAFEAERHSFEAERIRWRREREDLLGELSRPFHVLERSFRLGRRRWTTELRIGFGRLEKRARSFWGERFSGRRSDSGSKRSATRSRKQDGQ